MQVLTALVGVVVGALVGVVVTSGENCPALLTIPRAELFLAAARVDAWVR